MAPAGRAGKVGAPVHDDWESGLAAGLSPPSVLHGLAYPAGSPPRGLAFAVASFSSALPAAVRRRGRPSPIHPGSAIGHRPLGFSAESKAEWRRCLASGNRLRWSDTDQHQTASLIGPDFMTRR